MKVVMDKESMDSLLNKLRAVYYSGNARCITEICTSIERCGEILRNSPHTSSSEKIISIEDFEEIIRIVIKIKRSDYAKSEVDGGVNMIVERVLDQLYYFLFNKRVS